MIQQHCLGFSANLTFCIFQLEEMVSCNLANVTHKPRWKREKLIQGLGIIMEDTFHLQCMCGSELQSLEQLVCFSSLPLSKPGESKICTCIIEFCHVAPLITVILLLSCCQTKPENSHPSLARATCLSKSKQMNLTYFSCMSPIEFEKTLGEQNFKVVPMTEKRF